MKIFLDNCAIQRPLDDHSNIRNRIEAEAVMGLFELIEEGIIDLVSSDVLLFELNNTRDTERVHFGKRVLSLSKETLHLTDRTIIKAKEYETLGLKAIDALHLSVAITNNIKYLVTCDDKFQKKAMGIKNIRTKVLLPTELFKVLIK